MHDHETRSQELKKIHRRTLSHPLESPHRLIHICCQIPSLPPGLSYNRQRYQWFTGELNCLVDTYPPSSAGQSTGATRSDVKKVFEWQWQVSMMLHFHLFNNAGCVLRHCSIPPCEPLHLAYENLAIQGVLWPQWALGFTAYQSHVHLTILGVLRLRWATGAPSWATFRSGHSQAFKGSPVSHESHYISTPCTSGNFRCSGSPMRHRSHYMNYMYIYNAMPSLVHPQWVLRTTISKTLDLAIEGILVP